MGWRVSSAVANGGRRCLAWLFAFAIAFVGIAAVDAQTVPPGFGQYKHVRWGADEGAPDGINAIAQTPDGYLWLAGEALYRFDGSSFEQIDWPAGSGRKHASPWGMLVRRNGELWVGMRGGAGIAVYRDGVLRDLHIPEPPRVIADLAEAQDGTIWAASGMFTRRLTRLRGGRWEAVDDALKLPPGAVMALVPMRDGGLWVSLTHEDGNSGALAYLAPGASRFRELPYRLAGRPHIAQDAKGALWVSDALGTRMLLDAQGNPPVSAIGFAALPGLRTASIAFDRVGGLWGTTASTGVFHIPGAGATRGVAGTAPFAFAAANGLTSDFAYAPFVDREGSVWIATEGGVDQFRRAAATQELAIPAAPVHGLAIATAPDGTVYIEALRTLYRIVPGQAPKPVTTLGSDEVAMCTARAGGIWIVETSRLLHVEGERVAAMPGHAGGKIAISCAEDRLGRLWTALFDNKLTWHDAKGWHAASGALAETPAWDLVATSAGDIAFSTPKDLATIRGNQLTVQRLASAGIGSASMVATGIDDLFLSGARGLVRVRDGRLSLLPEARFPWLAQLRELVQTPQGETWLISRNAISRVATADLDRAFADPHAPLARTLFNAQDGLASETQHGGFTGLQAVVGGDGRVWFLNRQGAAFFDPATLRQNPLAPPVAIRSLATGGQSWRDPVTLDLKPGTRTVDIAYAGLSLETPQRVRFRYRLEGVDDGWVDAGSRRLASYANLGPGNYRFQVIAANNDGVWNDKGAMMRFTIRPTFWQSWPFKLLCALAVMLLAWLAYSMRMRTVANRIRLRMAERIEERERIARELHDTLLQSIQSLTLRFQLAVDDLPPKQVGRPSLIAAIDTADRVIAEGRDRVHDLRSRQDGDIEQIIRDLLGRQGFAPCVEVSLTTTGAPCTMDPLALDEVARIAGEGLFNIRRHAGAARIAVEIRHGASFLLCITDDGIGIDAEVAAHGRQGHFGLSGMRERARKLRGDLVIRPLPGRGTELRLTVPGGIAYKGSERGLLARLWSS